MGRPLGLAASLLGHMEGELLDIFLKYPPNCLHPHFDIHSAAYWMSCRSVFYLLLCDSLPFSQPLPSHHSTAWHIFFCLFLMWMICVNIVISPPFHKLVSASDVTPTDRPTVCSRGILYIKPKNRVSNQTINWQYLQKIIFLIARLFCAFSCFLTCIYLSKL